MAGQPRITSLDLDVEVGRHLTIALLLQQQHGQLHEEETVGMGQPHKESVWRVGGRGRAGPSPPPSSSSFSSTDGCTSRRERTMGGQGTE